MELPKRRLADIISHCEICLINFKFKYRTSLVSLIFFCYVILKVSAVLRRSFANDITRLKVNIFT